MSNPSMDERTASWHDDLAVDRLCDDFERCWHAGEKPRIEDYLARLPDVDRLFAFSQLLAMELALRQEQGEHPTAQEYLARFPDYAPTVDSVLQLFDSNAIAAQSVDSVKDIPTKVASGFPSPGANGDTNTDVSLVASPNSLSENWPPDLHPRYHCLSTLGEGGFGCVFKAWDTTLQVFRAIKVPTSRALEYGVPIAEYVHEARKLAKLDHPGIVRLLDAQHTADGQVYLVMEFMPGGTLRQKMEQADISVEEKVRWVVSICEALEYLHRRGVMHRDIKPDNILFDEKGQPRLGDFGLAIGLHDIDRARHKAAGTLGYISPEQLKHAHATDGRSDIFSLGVLLYQQLTGEFPYHVPVSRSKDFEDELLSEVAVRPPREINPDLDPAIEQASLRALEKRPENRYSTAADFAEALRQAIAKPVPTAPHRRVWRFVVAAATIALAMWMVAMLVPPSRDSARPFPLNPDLVLHLQRADEQETYRPILSSANMPLREGDKVQVLPEVAKGAYCYVFWINPNGEVERIYSEQYNPAHAGNRLKLPVGPETGEQATWFEMSGQGHHMVLVGQTADPVSEQQLKEFAAQNFRELEGMLPQTPLVEFEFPWQGRTKVQRGVGKNVVISPKEQLPSLADYLRLFDAYHGWRFVCEAEGS